MDSVRKAAERAMALLKDTGAQLYRAEAHSQEKTEFNVDGGQFSLLRSTFDKGLDLMLVKDQRRGKVSCNDFDEEALRQAVQDCLSAAQSAEPDPHWQLFRGEPQRFVQGAPECDRERLFTRAEELLAAIKKEYPKVMVEQMIVSHSRVEALYLNSQGARYETLEGQYDGMIMYSAHEGEKTSSFNGADFSTESLDTPFIEMGGVRQGLRDIQLQIDTLAPEGKYEGSVIFTPECAAEVLGELLENFAGDGALLDGTSPWKDSLGTPVADSRLTVSLAPLDPSVVCGERYQQDGRLSEDYAVIEKGALRRFMLSQYVASKIGGTPAPNSSRSMVVAPGEESLKEIIAGVRKGLIVDRFSGGSPAGNGDFSGIAKNSFLIENGRLGPAVSQTMISGNLAQMVKKLRGISKERQGSGRGLMPWIAVDGITISGK